MDWITTLDDLHTHYGTPAEAATVKVTDHLTPAYRAWIDRARFCILTTVGPEGSDGSPRGDDGPVVTVLDPQTLALPDWHGNNRIDSLRNIVRDGRVSLMFLIPGANNALRVNGTARLTADPDLRHRFARDGKQPRTVIVIRIAEVYSQCARALIRSALWTGGDQSAGLPTVGDMLREITEGRIDGKAYDADWPGRAALTMW
ncbi:MAG: pyridoxamine 5'-phosphate oxidase family protein [Paracoccaceae bacterium]